MATIEVFADVVCPFTHVGLRRLIEARAERGSAMPLVVRSWPLELVNGAPLSAAKVSEEIEAIREQVAPDLFEGFDAEVFPTTSIPALALTISAYRHGLEKGEAVALALRWALFEGGLDVTDPEVLASIASAHGVEPATAADVDAVRADWQEGRQRGVVGSPHFLVGSDGFFCPGLDISHDAAGFSIAVDRRAFAEFADRALGPPA
jgi:predicted DsbA family dithiol-disulfide isomerase